MEVVVSFADGDECCEDVVSGCVFVVEGGFAEPVREGVDAECALREY